jgi:phytoene dehydrogenase-like protein
VRLDAAVVGGGIAGLACAVRLVDAGRSVCVLERSDAVGGRVRTDLVDGFRVDRGFQVLPTAYPEAAALLDYPALDLRPFYPGALVRAAGRFHRVADPFRHPVDAVRSAFSPVGTLGDKLRLLRLRRRARAGNPESLFARPQTTTVDLLRASGLSDAMIESFLRPFLSGVFLERELATASGSFEFVWRMFSAGDAALPAHGMGRIPEQLAGRLPAGTVRVGAAASAVDAHSVTLASGERVEAAAVVVATDGAAAAALTGDVAAPPVHAACTLSFAAARSPLSEPILVLNGEGTGPITTLCVPSDVSPAYAPEGSALVSAGTVGTAPDPSAVVDQLTDWFGPEARTWRLLRVDRIPAALPAYPPGSPAPGDLPIRLPSGVFVCGDHREHPSLNGALASGRRAAEAVLGR